MAFSSTIGGVATTSSPGFGGSYTAYAGGFLVSPPRPAPVVALSANATPAPTPLPKQQLQLVSDLLYGKPIPISAGKRLLRGRVLWYTKPRTITLTGAISAADVGTVSRNGVIYSQAQVASSGTAVVCDIAVSFGQPLSSNGKRDVLQIRCGVATGGDAGVAATVIYDKTISPIVNAKGLNFTYYPGSYTQPVDPTIEADRGVGLTQAFRGQHYIVFRNFPLDLFNENGNLVEPLFGAVIADDTFSSVATENFTISTGESVSNQPGIDWASGTVYFCDITAYRIVASELWGTHSELYSLPIVNLSSAFTSLAIAQVDYIDGLQLLLAVADGLFLNQKFVLINPFTGRVVCEMSDTKFNAENITDLINNFAWSVDTVHAQPVYLFAMLSLHGRLEVFAYNAATNIMRRIVDTGEYLGGAAPSVSATCISICRGKSEGGQAVFWIGSQAHVHKVVIDADHETATITTLADLEANLVHYMPSEDCLLVFSPAGLATKYRCSDASVRWQKTLSFTMAKPYAGAAPTVSTTDRWRRSAHYFGAMAGGSLKLLDLADGTETALTGPAVSGTYLFDSETKSFLRFPAGGGAPTMYRPGGTGSGSYAFSDLTLALAERAGYAPGAVTISGIPDTFGGVVIDQDLDFQDFLRIHQDLLGYENVQDQSIRLFRIPDDPPIDFTITPEMCIDPGQGGGPITVMQEQASSFASRLDVVYPDASLDYAPTTQTITRPVNAVTTESLKKDTISTPLIMTADQAVTLGTAALYRRIMGGTRLTLQGMPLLGAVTPGDICLVHSGGNSYTAKVKQASLGGSLQNQITLQAILTKTSFTGLGSSGATPPFVYSLPDPSSDAILLDGPLFAARGDLGGRALAFNWVATSLGQAAWSGAQFFYGFDGVNYVAAAGTALESQVVHFGTVIAALGTTASPFMSDYANTFSVVPRIGDFTDFASVTYADRMNETTLAYIGAPGRWEVIAWETITANADGSYTFSGLSRGLYGTEVFCGTHQVGDYFVPIAGQDVYTSAFATGALGEAVYYRGVGIDQPLFASRPHLATVTGNAEKPPAPVHLDAVISGSDIALSCDRRSRFGAHPAVDWTVTDSEDEDEWQFDIVSGGTVLRTLTSTTPGKTYVAADITADFGSMPASLTFRAYRVGHDGGFSVGRGFEAAATVALS